MSLFSSIGKFFKKLLDALIKLLKWLLPILIIALIVIAIFFPYLLPVIWAWVGTAWTAVSGWVATAWGWISSGASFLWKAATEWVAEASFADVLKLAAGAAVILNPEGVADAAGGLLETVVDAVAPIVSTALPWLIAGAVAYFVFTSDGGEDEKIVYVDRRDDYA